MVTKKTTWLKKQKPNLRKKLAKISKPEENSTENTASSRKTEPKKAGVIKRVALAIATAVFGATGATSCVSTPAHVHGTYSRHNASNVSYSNGTYSGRNTYSRQSSSCTPLSREAFHSQLEALDQQTEITKKRSQIAENVDKEAYHDHNSAYYRQREDYSNLEKSLVNKPRALYHATDYGVKTLDNLAKGADSLNKAIQNTKKIGKSK